MLFITELENNIDNSLSALSTDLSKIALNQQSDIFDLIKIDCYGSMMALPHIAMVTTLDHTRATIQPYDKNLIKTIDKALRDSRLDLSTQIGRDNILVQFPRLTLERRDKLLVYVKEIAEKAKVSIRNHRRDAIRDLEKLKLSEDEERTNLKKIEGTIQKALEKVTEAAGNRTRKLEDLK